MRFSKLENPPTVHERASCTLKRKENKKMSVCACVYVLEGKNGYEWSIFSLFEMLIIILYNLGFQIPRDTLCLIV